MPAERRPDVCVRRTAPARRLAPWLFALVACGAPEGHAQPTPPAPAPAPRCQTEPYRSQGTAIGCPDLGFVAVLPGRGWSLRESVANAPRVVLSAELAPYFQMAVMAGASRVSSTGASRASGGATSVAVLQGLYERAAESARAQGLELTPAELGESRTNRPTLMYEVRGLTVGGQPYRSLHVWTSARRPDGVRLDYHLSWTGPADRFDPELPETLAAATAAFVLVDRGGHAIAD
jgi:hypothetical protein